MLTNELNGRNGMVNGTKAPGKAGSTRKPAAKVVKVARTRAHKDRVAVAVACASAVSTVALSMCLNTWAFTAVHGGWFGTALGVLLPLWVLALTYQAFHMRRRQLWVSVGCYVLAGFALVVSLPHLAHGYASLGLHEYEGWSLALVTDLLQVLMKLSLVKMVGRTR